MLNSPALMHIIKIRWLLQVVNFHESNAIGVVYTAHDGGVVTRRQVCNDRRLEWIRWSMTAVLNIHDLIPCDNAADYRGLPVVIGSNQCSGSVVQFQCRISQWIGNAKRRANGAHNHPSVRP